MAGFVASSTPAPLPASAIAIAVGGAAASPIAVPLYDENEHQTGTVAIWRDGWTDDETTVELKKLFRCRTTHREHQLAQKTLAMLADVAEHYPDKTIEYVSVYRVGGAESQTSPHRGARAIDFRVRGVDMRQIRDYVWRTYSDVGVGWYPSEQFIHIDTRPGLHDTAWTFLAGVNRYHPYWAELARQPQVATATRDRGPKS
jgi:uncharacterized protein YcbK (DUF882 family)